MDLVHYESSYYQVDTFEQCPRKWGWEALDGVEREKNKFALLGISGHDILKGWLAERIFLWDQPASKIAAEMTKYLPPPQAVKREHVEMPFRMVLADVDFIGDMDLFVPAGVVSEFPRVYDHKFTTDLKWAKPADLLDGDIQATLYAAAGLLKTGVREIEVQWTYGRTKGKPEAKPVVARFNGAMIRARVEKSIETSRHIRLIREAKLTALQLPYNAGACQAYGGCPFRQLCNLTPQEEMESVMSQGSAQERFLAELRAGRQNGQPVTQPVNPPQTATQPASTGGVGVLAALKASTPPLPQMQVAAPAAPAAQVVPQAQILPQPQHTPATLPQSQVAVEVQVAEPSKAARSPGRPKTSPLEERWAGFLGAARLVNQSVAQAAVDADDMLREYLQRFGS